jgi:2-polyprenyl-3-methyl-5-hydroxy-6-metoxy-1,4-benzoquinol methylase
MTGETVHKPTPLMPHSRESAMSVSSVYDQRYSGDYREHLSGYEIARWEALDHFVTHVLKLASARKVLDYGAGSGLHVDLWEKIFPEAELHFCDISSVAMEKFKAKYPRHADRYSLVCENQPDCYAGTFDVIASVEVMEHVEDLNLYLLDIRRLLKPGGMFVWTTPCANHLSIEHIFSLITGKIERTKEGFRRWQWEDPTHVRRLRSNEIESILRENGFWDVRFRFRSHFFSFICTYFPTQRLNGLRNRLMTLDYTLFRCLPNGASMIGAAVKSG